MSHANDPLFGIHARALNVASRRMELLASNLANADTPNYKAKDIDFRKALADAGSATRGVSLEATEPGHMQGSLSTGGMRTEYRVPVQPSLDGNTVDTQVEQGAFAENTVRYQASLSFLSGHVRSLLTAITGG